MSQGGRTSGRAIRCAGVDVAARALRVQAAVWRTAVDLVCRRRPPGLQLDPSTCARRVDETAAVPRLNQFLPRGVKSPNIRRGIARRDCWGDEKNEKGLGKQLREI